MVSLALALVLIRAPGLCFGWKEVAGLGQKVAGTRKRTAMNPNNKTARKKAFLEELRQRYSVYHACKEAGIGRTTVYAWRQDDDEFAKAWDAALADAVDVLEASAYQRALEGDTALTKFLLKGALPDKYKERTATELTGAGGKPLTVTFLPPGEGEDGGA